jgi:hypothetical protein
VLGLGVRHDRAARTDVLVQRAPEGDVQKLMAAAHAHERNVLRQLGADRGEVAAVPREVQVAD